MDIASQDFSTYFLRDPRDKSVFYVGITDNPDRRYNDHVSQVSGNYEKDTRIQQLSKIGLLPIMDIVVTGQTQEQARQSETYWIQYHREKGILLTNVSQNPKTLEFNGCRFRLALHMEWAIFFAESGIAYQYQKERGIRIKGSLHSPEFWLPSEECWVYIRTQQISRYDKEEADDLLKASGYSYRFYYGSPSYIY